MAQKRRGWGKRTGKKQGTKNMAQAAARDERLAAAKAADRAAAAELLADLAEPEKELVESPATVTKPADLTAGQRARRRAVIIWKYVELGSPPKKHWEGRDGTVSTIAAFLEQPEARDRRRTRSVRRAAR